MGAITNPSLGDTYTGADRWIVRLLPSLTDFAFLFPVLWLFMVAGGTGTLLSDGDTGWHIRTGEWIWQHRAVPTTDLFSFTRPHGDWYAWEWLWDILFAGVHHLGGLAAVAFANVCLLGILSVALFRLVRRTTDSDLLSLACTWLAMATSSIHWLARPHLFSWIFVIAFAHALLSAKRGDRRALAWLPVAMLFWTNLHGGFFVGILMLLLAAAGEVTGAFLHAEKFWESALQRSRPYLASAAACGLATFVNPYGWRLHSHIFQYLANRPLINQIGEYGSIDFHQPLSVLIELMLLLALPTMLWAVIRKQYATAVGIVFWVHISLTSVRNVPLFAMLTAPAIASMVLDIFQTSHSARRLRGMAAAVTAYAARIRPLERSSRLYAASAATVLVLAMSFSAGAPGFEGRFNEKTFPGSALPFIKAAKFSHLFTTDTWASYFVYQLYPNQPSFLDGRSDYFGASFVEEYGNVFAARWDWEAVLARYSVDAVALRPTAPLATALKASKNWQLRFDDGSVVVFQHAPAAGPSVVSARASKVSSVMQSGRKTAWTYGPSLIVSSNTKTQERRSS